MLGELGSGGVGGPSISTADEEAARTLFQGPSGGFMVNWPYVWRAANAAVEDGSLSAEVLADIGFARYPRSADAASRPPLGGIDIGIGAWSRHPDLALEAARCITSLENQTYYFLREGNPAARAEVFSAPSVVEAFPMAALLRASLEGAAPRPQTDVYGDLSAGVQHVPPAGRRRAGDTAQGDDVHLRSARGGAAPLMSTVARAPAIPAHRHAALGDRARPSAASASSSRRRR